MAIPDEPTCESEVAILRRALAQVTRQLDEALARLKPVDDDVVSARSLSAPDAGDPTVMPHSTIYTPNP